jgi:hypothetical protein
MYLQKNELAIACQSFPLKFLDISKRHKIMIGEDIIKLIKIDPVHLKFQLQQTIMNLSLRLRERYALVSLREEQLVHIMNEFSAPMRSSAFSLMQMKGKSARNPKDALVLFLQEYFPGRAEQLAKTISAIRESSTLSNEMITPTYSAFLEILNKMHDVIKD